MIDEVYAVIDEIIKKQEYNLNVSLEEALKLEDYTTVADAISAMGENSKDVNYVCSLLDTEEEYAGCTDYFYRKNGEIFNEAIKMLYDKCVG